VPEVLWIPIGAVVLGVLLGAMVGASSRSSSARSGALVGFYLSLMASFPLLALGLATT
jgi:hypothetical protein